MLFNSLQFLAFFPIVVGLYFLTPQRSRWFLLLAASYYFYMCWEPMYVLLIVASTLVDYFAAGRMHQALTKRIRRGYLLLSLGSNLGLLFAFKYSGFFVGSLNEFTQLLGIEYALPMLEILLPVGISFYTFQTLSYTIDVYRGAREPVRHLGKFSVYVAFFPQLVAGPIERSTSLLPQFDEEHHLDWERIKSGLVLMLWGFFMKLVIADQAGLFVDPIYAEPTRYSGISLLIATYLFSFQIYCDFAGYSNIAIGAARVLGFRLMRNFDRPYFSESTAEFWRRWHISLSSWFRDYLYIPLGGNRVGRMRWRWIILVVFLTSGLWHGANWTFLVWGALHGAYLVMGSALARWSGSRVSGRSRWGTLRELSRIFITYHLVALSWVFFRAASLRDAAEILHAVPARFLTGVEVPLGAFSALEFAAVCGPIGFLLGIEIWQGKREFAEFLASRPFAVRFAVYFTLLFGIACLGVFDANEFIYFQF